ncbi:MAG: chain length determinant protein, partial [Bacteroidetes bacterium]|nr:chain length determinant protein [Bacteroidota bacterium]
MASKAENFETNSLENPDTINIKEYFQRYSIYWRWFLVGMLLSLIIAFVYLRFTKPQFEAKAYITIKDNLKSGISDELKAFSDLGIVGVNSTNNPENEIFIINSRKIVGNMVDSLELTVRYFSKGSIKDEEIYKKNYFKINFINKDPIFNNLDSTFIVSYMGKNRLLLKDLDGKLIKEVRYNEIIDCEKLGKFKITPISKNAQNWDEKSEVMVVIKPRNKAIDAYQSRIKVETIDENSSVLSLSIADPIKLKAENILDELIKQYNIDAVIDKNIVSNKTNDFIEQRLQSISLQLALIQDNLKDYKTEFGITGYLKEGEIALNAATDYSKKIIELKTQLSLIDWVQQEMNKNKKNIDVLPVNLGFSDGITSKSISEYNELVLEKLRLEGNSGDKNPNLLMLTSQIKILKQSLFENFSNLKKSLEIQTENAIEESKKAQSKVSSMPLIERGIIDIQRQKLIYGELYSYLLKKKEELAIS